MGVVRLTKNKGDLTMPKYDYKCSKCGTINEVNQSIHDPPFTKCPNCGNPTYYRLIRAPNIIFKGTGFPGNDLKKKENQNES